LDIGLIEPHSLSLWQYNPTVVVEMESHTMDIEYICTIYSRQHIFGVMM